MDTLFEEQTLHWPIDYQSQTWAYSSPAHRAADSKKVSCVPIHADSTSITSITQYQFPIIITQ